MRTGILASAVIVTGAVDSATGAWTGSLAAPLADGTYTLKVIQRDAAGNEGSATAPLTIDATGPAISIAAPADGASLALGEAANAVFSCDDPAGVARCAGSRDAGAALDTAGPGEHRFTVVAADALGNSSTRTVTYTVGDAPPSPPELRLAITGATVTRCARPRRCARVTVTGTAPDGRVALVAVRGGSARRARVASAGGVFTIRLNLPRRARRARWDLTVTQGAAAAERRVTVPKRP